MKFTPEEFKAYIKRHHIAITEITESYIAENPKDEYVYDDLDAVYQMQVSQAVNRRVAHSQSEMLPAGKHYYARAGGGFRTISGTKGGDQR